MAQEECAVSRRNRKSLTRTVLQAQLQTAFDALAYCDDGGKQVAAGFWTKPQADYDQCVRVPIFLADIQDNLDSQKYTSRDQLRRAFKQLVRNSLSYFAPGSEQHANALVLKSAVNRVLGKQQASLAPSSQPTPEAVEPAKFTNLSASKDPELRQHKRNRRSVPMSSLVVPETRSIDHRLPSASPSHDMKSTPQHTTCTPNQSPQGLHSRSSALFDLVPRLLADAQSTEQRLSLTPLEVSPTHACISNQTPPHPSADMEAIQLLMNVRMLKQLRHDQIDHKFSSKTIAYF
jgi:hypothetical protein